MRRLSSAISSQIHSRKKIILGGLAIALLLSIVPLHFAQAGFWDGFLNIIAGILDYAVGTIASVIKVLAELIANAMERFIHMFMSFSVSPSNPGTPQIIKDGFNTSRQIVNIFFILILTFIGLATILRLQTYQMQKTLPSLIVVALLVNFSGLLVGFMADIGNLITSAFLPAGPAAGSAWGTWNLGDIPVINGAAGLGTHIVKIIYYIISILIYFIVILLFGIRVFALWTLTILAPLAAGAYILPASRKYWSQWLGQVIQWSIIGIPISFTLMLSKRVMSGGFTDFPSAWSGSALANLAAPFTALFLLFIGISLSMQLAPAGTQGIMSMGKKAGIAAGKFASKKALGFVRDRITESPRGRAALNWANKLSTTPSPTWGANKSWFNPLKWAARGATTAVSTIARAPGALTSTLLSKMDRDDFNEAKAKAAKEKDLHTNVQAFREAPNNAAKAGVYAGMTVKQRKDAMDKEKMGRNVITPEELKMVYTKANVLGDDDVVEAIERSLINDKTMIDLLAGIKTEFIEESKQSSTSGLTKDEEREGMRSFTDKIIADVKSADDAKQLGKGLDKNNDAVDAMHQFWGGPQFASAINEHGRKLSDKIEERKLTGAQYLATNPATEKQFNQKAAIYFASTAAQGFGLSAADGAETTEAIKEITTDIKVSQMPAGPAKMAAEINRMTKRLEILTKQQVTTPAQDLEITKLENEIESRWGSLGKKSPKQIKIDAQIAEQATAKTKKTKLQGDITQAEKDIYQHQQRIITLNKQIHPAMPGTPFIPRLSKEEIQRRENEIEKLEERVRQLTDEIKKLP